MNVTLTEHDVAQMAFAKTQLGAFSVSVWLVTDGMETRVLVSCSAQPPAKK
jgi:hypothetical protein